MKPYTIRYVFLFVLSFLAFLCVAQRAILVTDTDENALPGVTISILSPRDSLLKSATLTDIYGYFSLQDTISGDYLLMTRYPGYEDYTASVAECPDIIRLQPLARELHEITIIGNKDLLRQEAGKFIFTPGKLKGEVGTAYDLLPYVPLLSRTYNDKIEMIGKSGYYIYVNGRDLQMPKEQLLAELRTIPPDWIESIEVIVGPGSTISAGVNMGIINIILVDRRRGIRGNINVLGNLGEGRNFASEKVVLTLGHDRLQASLFSMFTASHHSSETNTQYTYNPGRNDELKVTNDIRNANDNKNWYNSLNLIYSITDKSRLSMGATMDFSSENKVYRSETEKTIRTQSPEITSGSSLTHQPWLNPGCVTGSLYYTLDIGSKGSRFEAGAMIRKGRSRTYTETDFSIIEKTDRYSDDKGLVAVGQYTQVFSPSQTLKGGI